jgi:hypothetical protein
MTRLRMVLSGLPTLVGTRGPRDYLERRFSLVLVPADGGGRPGRYLGCENVVEIPLQYHRVYLMIDIPNLSA